MFGYPQPRDIRSQDLAQRIVALAAPISGRHRPRPCLDLRSRQFPLGAPHDVNDPGDHSTDNDRGELVPHKERHAADAGMDSGIKSRYNHRGDWQ